MEGHSRPDLEVGIMAQSGHRIAPGPGRRLADADAIAAMMTPVMREAGVIDHLLPGRIDRLRPGARPDRRDDRIESLPHDGGDPRIVLAHRADMDKTAERRVIARHAA